MPDTQQPFFFDEFFGDDDGVEITLTLRGRPVPLRIKRGLTLKEKVAAQAVAIKRKVDPLTGRVVVDRIDEGAAAEEVAFLSLISWPFVNRDGTPVPITRENVNKLVGIDKLVELVTRMDQEGDEALAPFVAPSAEA